MNDKQINFVAWLLEWAHDGLTRRGSDLDVYGVLKNLFPDDADEIKGHEVDYGLLREK